MVDRRKQLVYDFVRDPFVRLLRDTGSLRHGEVAENTAGNPAAMRLTQLDAATTLNDLRFPPSNRLEALKDDRKGQWSIRINDQGRVCFRFENGDAFDVKSLITTGGHGSMNIKSGLAPIHPGGFLREALGELGTAQAEFARAIGISPMRISHVVNGTRPVTAELALLFGRALGQSPQYWLNLQAAYDLKTAEREIGPRLRGVRRLAHAGSE